MVPSKLGDRLSGILKPPVPTPAAAVSGSSLTQTESSLEEILGGAWRNEAHGACFVVERRLDAATTYGQAAVGEIAARLEGGAAEASLVAGGAPASPPFVFFDVETTGLSGGAGTYAFLVGCGWFDEDGAFLTRQYLLVRFADERPLLANVTGELARAGALISFNGKSFDAPVLEMRYLYHRLEWVGARLPHIDVLHPARQFWKARGGGRPGRSVLETHEHRGAGAEASGRRASSNGAGGVAAGAIENGGTPREMETCSLAALEQQVLGAPRVGDVPSFEIPARYFHFVRTGDGRPLAGVLEHNRLDLLSLAGLTARLLDLVRVGPDHARDGREALALGRVYGRAGLDARARAAYARAVSWTIPSGVIDAPIRIEALRALALAWRRVRQYDKAAACWRQILDEAACPRHVMCKASEALAIYHEHRLRDLIAARAFALRSLESGLHPAWTEAVRHRLARLERKLGAADRDATLRPG